MPKVYYYNTELYHHGIVGMKWGVRRFQNPNGSLTSEGRARYSIKEDGSDKSIGRSYKKALTKLDRASAKGQYEYKKNDVIADKYDIKAYNTKNDKKRLKYINKSKEAKAKSKQALKEFNDIEKQIKNVAGDALKNGYNISVKEIARTTAAQKGKKIASSLLAAPVYYSYITTSRYADSGHKYYNEGYRYKVKKTNDGSKGSFNVSKKHTRMNVGKVLVGNLKNPVGWADAGLSTLRLLS